MAARSGSAPCWGAGCDYVSHPRTKATDVWTVGPGGTVIIDPEPFAAAIVERLSASVIPSSFPARIGEQIRQACGYGGSLYRHIIPLGGPVMLCAEYRMNPDGTLQLEFQDTSGQPFWRGTFRPAGEATDADA
jgi:hypothetical protein